MSSHSKFLVATLPMKYYDLDRWEMEEYRRSKVQSSSDRDGILPDSFNDEEDRRAELRRQRELEEQRQFRELKEQMSRDKEMTEGMRRQEELRIQLQLAHKQGDLQTVRRVERLLAPEPAESASAVKHPWS